MTDGQTLLLLYGPDGRILATAGALPKPYRQKEVVGTYPWDYMSGPDVNECQAAFMRAVSQKTIQRFDVAVKNAGIWRTLFFPVELRNVRVIGFARRFPDAALRLTDREREVCRAVADGLSSKQMAKLLGITTSTVDNHRAHVARKIGIKTNQLCSWAAANREWLER